jgi:SAM-dependent methyltransferase
MTAAAGLTQKTSALPFADYARYYDLLYRDKDYAGEAGYVARRLRSAVPNIRSVLELGSGTGRHGRLLAAMGFDVFGVERSPDMVALAKAETVTGAGSFSCSVGDACTVRLERCFDAVTALFHVVSYQTTDDDLRAIFATASQHLLPGGIFLFDVWHGPAVLAQRPERRVKKVADAALELTRTATPQLDVDRHTVTVTYDVECSNRQSGKSFCFSEDHLVRYLFPDEIEKLATAADMRAVRNEEFATGRLPSSATWGVAYLLQKCDLSGINSNVES